MPYGSTRTGGKTADSENTDGSTGFCVLLSLI